ncbi:MAG: hypothetical protein ACRD0H_05140 [Actinomycetes bacterium]
MTTTLGSATPRRLDVGHQSSPGRFEPGRFALRDTWFPVEHTPKVKRTPRLRRIHGRPYWLWRDGVRFRAAALPVRL